MGFRKKPELELPKRKRAKLYLRVSTKRQFLNAVSVSSQRQASTRHCAGKDWDIVGEYVESGTATSDERRPAFRQMIRDACDPNRDFDVIVVYAFNRFYRNGADMELEIRKLRRQGVEVVSVTQPTNDDPASEMMRKIIGIFDEHTSAEIGKNTRAPMVQSAEQGFWNGSTPPLGYKIVEAERRGQKIKKKLDIDAVEAELVRLIFKLYLDGHDGSGPLGVKETTKWLNSHGYRTRRGAMFGVGTLHKMLTKECYATGLWKYGKRDSRNGGWHQKKSATVDIPVPVIIEMGIFQRVQAKLGRNNPRTTPPRVVNGPSLLIGIAVCASCGSGMTRTGTVRRGKNYSYYTCAGSHQKGEMVCEGRHIPAGTLDGLVLSSLKRELFAPARLAGLLRALQERHSAQAESVDKRRLELQREISDCDERLRRFYRSIEDGVIEEESLLRERIGELRTKKDQATAALERMREQLRTNAEADPARIDAFAKLVNEKLDGGDVNVRRSYIRSVVDGIEVDDAMIRIVGRRDVLQALIAGGNTVPDGVRGFVRKWRARRDSNS